MKNLVYVFLLFGFITSCAHHRDVRPSQDGHHKVVLHVEDKDEGYRDAMSQAEDYCKQYNKQAYVDNEGAKYTGNMKEEDYNKGKTVSKVAQGVGGALSVFGGKNEQAVGGVGLIGGSVARGVMGNGYTYQMNFICK